MSLNYDIRNVPERFKEDGEWAITNALIWGTLSVQMGSISVENWKEFYTRCHMVEAVYGPWLMEQDDDGKPVPRRIQPTDVRNRIGLHTNAGTMSPAKFKTGLDRGLRDQAKGRIMRSEDAIGGRQQC